MPKGQGVRVPKHMTMTFPQHKARARQMIITLRRVRELSEESETLLARTHTIHSLGVCSKISVTHTLTCFVVKQNARRDV